MTFESTASLRLITIPVSHYCEKARWALERARLPYREIRHIQLLHYGSTLFHAGSLFAPLLLTPEGPIKDSSDILAFVDRMAGTRHTLFPADPAQREKVLEWEELFDTTVGVESRRWMYHVGFRELGVDKMVEFAAQGVPSWQPPLVKLLVAPAKAYLNARLDISDDTVNAGLARLTEVFDRVGAVLADGRRYLVGDRFTAADLTFAALASLVLLPAEYGVRMPEVASLPPSMRETVEGFRESAAGRYALRLFATERNAAA